MVQIVLSKNSTRNLDGSNHKAVMNFLTKLNQDDTQPGLRVKPLEVAADRRVRTARINDDMRAVLFKFSGGEEPVYLLHGVWPHDEGNSIAARIIADVNPINGQFLVSEVETSSAPPASAAHGVPLHSAYTADADLAYSWLGSYGYTVKNLHEFFGLPADVAKRALTKQSDDELLGYAEKTVGWVQGVLLQLAAGDTKDEILEQQGLTVSAGDADSTMERTAVTDRELVDALRTDVAGAEYTFVEGEDELRAIIESGTFEQWLRFLHPEQRSYVNLHTNGPFRLSGAAGTGKTVVLVHRTRHLAVTNPDAKIILTTFNRTLAEGVEEQLLLLDPAVSLTRMGEAGVTVASVDSLAHTAIRNARDRGNLARLNAAMQAVLGGVRPEMDSRRGPRWETAVSGADLDASKKYLQSAFLTAEYEEVILPNQVLNLREYLRVRRPGRGMGLNRGQRREVWQAVEAYRAEAQVMGGLSFAEVAAVAAELMKKRVAEKDPYYADHVLIDEGQDLSAVQWQFLRGLVPAGPDDMFIAEDSQQRIYGRQLVLSHFGVQITGRSRRLTLNYRTTAQNLDRAVQTLEGETYLELEGKPVTSARYRSARQGPDPVDVEVENLDQAIVKAADHVARWVKDEKVEAETVGVLAPFRSTVEKLAEALVGRGVPARVITREESPGRVAASGSVQAMTMHRAKGLEFVRVVMVVEPLPTGWDREADQLRSRSLTYVAMTRARDELVVVQER